jgi:hypothetical protein
MTHLLLMQLALGCLHHLHDLHLLRRQLLRHMEHLQQEVCDGAPRGTRGRSVAPYKLKWTQ